MSTALHCTSSTTRCLLKATHTAVSSHVHVRGLEICKVLVRNRELSLTTVKHASSLVSPDSWECHTCTQRVSSSTSQDI